MHALYITIGVLYLIALIYLLTNLAWLSRVERKFKALFDICAVCRANRDFDTWQRVLDVIDFHLDTVNEYKKNNPLHWYKHWHDDWTKEVHTGDKQHAQHATRLPN